MLLEFACSNHRSIREEILFSMMAGTDTTDEDRLYETAGLKVLKSAVIYGANGSGKSNLLDAISFLCRLVAESGTNLPGKDIRQQPFKLDGAGRESTYKVQLLAKGVRYAYGVSLKEMRVAEEYLYCFPNNRRTKVFERSGDVYTAGSRFRGKFSACKAELAPNQLLLSCAAQRSTVQEVKDVFTFFCQDLFVYAPAQHDGLLRYSLCRMWEDPALHAAVIVLLGSLGTGIKDIDISINREKLASQKLPSFLSEAQRFFLLGDTEELITAKVKYDRFETDLMQEESAGITKLLAFVCLLIDTIIGGRVLFCDSLESDFHPSLLRGLVKQFETVNFETFPQMIFTTHETELLNLDLFRRDQIWFTELRKEDRSTDLYSLIAIKNVRKEENFERGYLAGKYGAIPVVNLHLGKIVCGQ
ncbi:MAG: ATP-binding protein [Clostridia bacterium]|nr:ATP-binding protein [Clostridia bacterium]